MKTFVDYNKIAQRWVKRLHLEDWVIDFRYNCMPDDFRLRDVAGECEKDVAHKIAIVRIINPACYGDRIVPFNFEKTLVHELLHIKFTLIDDTDDDIHDTIVHQLIEDMARLLTEKSN